MHPFSVTFHESENLVFKIISVILALFIVGTWIYNSSHIKLIFRVIGAIVGGFTSYYIAVFFFGILQFSYTTVKDNFDTNKISAKIIGYEKHISTTSSRNRKRIGSNKRTNTFYRPLLEYKDKNGLIKNTYGDVSFSINNKKSVGSEIQVIVENNEARMITPIKNFAFVMNIMLACFLVIFYYIFYNYARTQSSENIGTFALAIFGFVIFPIAFGVLIYLFLNIGYDYFFLNKKYTSRNVAILFSGLGIFLVLCLFGFIRFFIEKTFGKKRKKKNKKKKKSKNNAHSIPES